MFSWSVDSQAPVGYWLLNVIECSLSLGFGSPQLEDSTLSTALLYGKALSVRSRSKRGDSVLAMAMEGGAVLAWDEETVRRLPPFAQCLPSQGLVYCTLCFPPPRCGAVDKLSLRFFHQQNRAVSTHSFPTAIYGVKDIANELHVACGGCWKCHCLPCQPYTSDGTCILDSHIADLLPVYGSLHRSVNCNQSNWSLYFQGGHKTIESQDPWLIVPHGQKD